MDRIPLTKEGYERLQEELSTLKNETRPALIEAIAAARAHGDLSEKRRIPRRPRTPILRGRADWRD